MIFDPSRACPDFSSWFKHRPCLKHDCNQYIFIDLVHPTTGADMSEWMCSRVANVLVGMKTAQEARQGAAATESFRNAVVGLAPPYVANSSQHIAVAGDSNPVIEHRGPNGRQ